MSMGRWVRLILGLLAVGFVAGCGDEPGAPASAPPAPDGTAQVQPSRAAPSPVEQKPGFVDMVKEAGITWSHHGVRGEIESRLNLYDHGSAVAVADFDGDGKEDVLLLSQVGGNALLHNLGGNKFEDVAEKAGVKMAGRVCIATGFADYDNDGFPDLYVATTRSGNKLFHNEKNGTFKDVTKEAGVEYTGHSGTVCWFDYDGDGKLDLFVGNTGKYTTDTVDQASQAYTGTGFDPLMWLSAPVERALLYHNNGNGTFTEVAQKAGVAGKGWISDATACDYDGDGKVDLYVSRMFGDNFLYRNKGDGTFEDVTEKALKRTSTGAMGARWIDADNDGLPDLYVVDMHSDMWIPSNSIPPDLDEYKRYDGPSGPLPIPPEGNKKLLAALGNPKGLFGNTFFRNKGDGSFEEMAPKVGLENFWPWGIGAGDFDNDGKVDFFLACGMGYPWDYWPNYLLMHDDGLHWTNRARERGVEPRRGGETYAEPFKGRPMTRSSRSVASGDFDGDGRLDLVVNNFNHEPSYLHNEFPAASWLEVKLTGKKNNRDAIGASVLVKAGNTTVWRTVEGGGGYLSQSSRVLHFGLGAAKAVDEIEVHWPGKTVQKVAHPQINTLVKIEES